MAPNPNLKSRGNPTRGTRKVGDQFTERRQRNTKLQKCQVGGRSLYREGQCGARNWMSQKKRGGKQGRMRKTAGSVGANFFLGGSVSEASREMGETRTRQETGIGYERAGDGCVPGGHFATKGRLNTTTERPV